MDRFAQGIEVWNAWAEELLANREALVEAGEWEDRPTSRSGTMAWRKSAAVDFAGHMFDTKVDFAGFLFPGAADFKRVHFQKAASFREVVFEGDAMFSDAEFHGAAIFAGAAFKTMGFFNTTRFLGETVFAQVRAKELSFRSTRFSQDADLSGIGAEFLFMEDVVTFGLLGLKDARIERGYFHRSLFHKRAVFAQSVFENTAQFNDTQFLAAPDFRDARCGWGTTFARANMAGADFQNADLNYAKFDLAVLYSADFSHARLIRASLQGAELDYATKFTGAATEEMRIDRYALESLENYGGLTVGARMKMDIHDDVATLRSEYSGFLGAMHLLALIGFVFPYAWFVTVQWGRASFPGGAVEASIPLWEALLRFIYNGGQDWQAGWAFHPSFVLFCIALSYNAVRAILLKKTKELEMREATSGLPAPFSLQEALWRRKKSDEEEEQVREEDRKQSFAAWLVDGILGVRWLLVYQISRIGFYVYLVVVLGNLIHFLTMRVPVGLGS